MRSGRAMFLRPGKAGIFLAQNGIGKFASGGSKQRGNKEDWTCLKEDAYFLKMTAQNTRFGMVKRGSSVLTPHSFRIPDSEFRILREGARRILE
ncbi:MAG TPA: hypothetical protein VF345_09795 [Chthoniobacterales bacterium]